MKFIILIIIDFIKDCCNCCQLGIQSSKNNETCSSKAELSSQCNKIQLDCCLSTQSDNVVTPSKGTIQVIFSLLKKVIIY